jgi:hypothetical protein
MKLPALSVRSLLPKAALAAAALGGLLVFAGAPAANANPSDDCHRRLAYANLRYDRAVERYGPNSPAARHWAFLRHEAYERCHRDWR